MVDLSLSGARGGGGGGGRSLEPKDPPPLPGYGLVMAWQVCTCAASTIGHSVDNMDVEEEL